MSNCEIVEGGVYTTDVVQERPEMLLVTGEPLEDANATKERHSGAVSTCKPEWCRPIGGDDCYPEQCKPYKDDCNPSCMP